MSKQVKITRSRMTSLTHHWNHRLTEESRQQWNRKAKGKMSGFNLYLIKKA